MDKLIIEAGHPLYGTVAVSGAKNAALPLLAATLLCPGRHFLHNVPDLRDTRPWHWPPAEASELFRPQRERFCS